MVEFLENLGVDYKFQKIIAKILNIAIISIFAIIIIFNSVYNIGEEEQAVITTFGNPTTIAESGLKFKIPFIQKLTKVKTTNQGFSIGYDEKTNQSIEKESLMITYDYNFVNVDFYLEYKVIDPTKALFNSDQPLFIVKNLAQSYIRDTIGIYNVDDVITTGKNEIQAEIREKLTKRIEEEDLGIQILNISIQDSEPPTSEVLEAFKAVETAKQGKETAINKANQYKNEKMPEALATVDEILKKANATKLSRINEAEGQVARFNSIYEEYTKYPLITKQRMFYETMEKVLPDLKIIIDNGNGSVQKLLPLETLIDTNMEGK